MRDDTCPICLAVVPLNWAVEWDNGEPAPNTGGKGYMSVCATCHKGVYGQITPWQWVAASIRYERKNATELKAQMNRISLEVNALAARV
jgi:hypothetical protein